MVQTKKMIKRNKKNRSKRLFGGSRVKNLIKKFQSGTRGSKTLHSKEIQKPLKLPPSKIIILPKKSNKKGKKKLTHNQLIHLGFNTNQFKLSKNSSNEFLAVRTLNDLIKVDKLRKQGYILPLVGHDLTKTELEKKPFLKPLTRINSNAKAIFVFPSQEETNTNTNTNTNTQNNLKKRLEKLRKKHNEYKTKLKIGNKKKTELFNSNQKLILERLGEDWNGYFNNSPEKKKYPTFDGKSGLKPEEGKPKVNYKELFHISGLNNTNTQTNLNPLFYKKIFNKTFQNNTQTSNNSEINDWLKYYNKSLNGKTHNGQVAQYINYINEIRKPVSFKGSFIFPQTAQNFYGKNSKVGGSKIKTKKIKKLKNNK